MKSLRNKKFENAVNHKAQACPPIWFMRQAGRYHDHYQALRKKYSFIELCKKSELACEVTMGPIRDFDYDVAILFSDLLFPLEALGMGLKYEPGPKLGWHLNESNLSQLDSSDKTIEQLHFQAEAIQKISTTLPDDKSFIGFVGGPWTLFTYAVEGSHAGGCAKAKASVEKLWKPFCEVIMPLLEKNIQLQLDAGVELVMVFDTAAGELSPLMYKTFVLPMLKKMQDKFPDQLGYYAKQVTDDHYSDFLVSGSDNWLGMGFDHKWDIKGLLKTRKKGFIQGNFDQYLFFTEADDFKRKLDLYIEDMLTLSEEERAGWVCGLGHGVLPKTPQENVKYFINKIREVF